MRNVRGLGLTEMIVIVIIIIINILFIVFFANDITFGRSEANRVKCLNNLKQIGTGLALYSSDTYYGIMPPLGPKTLLYRKGKGILGKETVFHCPSADTPPHPFGDYARDICWDQPGTKPPKIIAGDYGSFANHSDCVNVLFKDGFAGTIDSLSGIYDSTDNVYDTIGDPVNSTTRSCLTARD